MQSNGAIGNIKKLDDTQKNGVQIDYAAIDWFDTEKAIIRLTTQGGREIGVRQPSGARLCDGDILYKDEKLIIAVSIKKSKLLYARFDDIRAAGRVCYELGNRHLPVVITEQGVTVPYDEPTELYLKGLGFAPEKVDGVFTGTLVKHHHHAHE